MADVQPLRGIRYASQVVGDLAHVITPPYDVISAEAQARYYARSPYNVIRLELGLEETQDSTLDNRYTRAAKTLAEWRMQGALRQEAAPCFYLYQQTFAYGGQSYTRTSLLARVRLEPWHARVVLPHEHTLAKPKDDRLKLLRACATNLSPVMSMYEDPEGRIRGLLSDYAEQAEVQVTDEAQEGHRLHPMNDTKQIEHIQSFFAGRQLFIADGHHRYETALAYREEVLEARHHLHVEDAVNFVLMALIDLDDPGLLVLPTHRIIANLSQGQLEQLNGQQLTRFFTVRELAVGDYPAETPLTMLAQAGEETPAFVVSTATQSWLLSPNEQGKARMAQSGHSDAWNGLDVAIAHTLALEELLGLSNEDLTAGTYVRYTRDAREALNAVREGQAQVALLLKPTRVRQVCEVAQADDRMPQKSTYFYPKLMTGLVMNPLW